MKYSMAKAQKKPKSLPNRSKASRLFDNLLRITEQFMGGKGFVSLDESQLIAKLAIPPQNYEIFRDVLATLLKNGVIELTNHRYMLKSKREEVVTGILSMHPRGFGFLQPHDAAKHPQDIFIPKQMTQNAVDGDEVEVLINPDSYSEKGPEGKVITILSRGRTHMAGVIRSINSYGEILAYVPLLGTAQKVVVQPSKEFPLKVGDRVVMEVVEWGEKSSETTCRVSHHIGHISDASLDVPAAIEEFEIKSDFPAQVIKDAAEFGTRVKPSEIKDREDFRDVETFTIDPDTAKDFDDALSLRKDSKGHYHLMVHIADVSYYVSAGSALDIEASERCNSTYFPGTVVPMLPHELSSHLCSLKPNVNRLAITVVVEFNPSGDQLNYRIVRSVIKSVKRFTYKEAKKVLDGELKSVHAPTLNLMVELCGLLKKKRYERGSIEFAMPELVVLVDENGVPQKTDYITYDITHQLVEEFMLKANEIVATHLTNLGKNLTYRIHDVPLEENLKEFSTLAGVFGFHLSETPTPKELQKLFDEAMETPYGEYLATSYIRRMRLAVYSTDNIGHYGLSLTHYCHFTSPIRRYVDLVAHRILFGGDDNIERLRLTSDRCSEQERISAKAEQNVVLLKKLRLIDANYQKDKNRQYEAVVTRVKNFGFFFEVLDFMLESYLHVSELDNDYFVFDEAKNTLKGRNTGQSYFAGEKIIVMLKEVNLITVESKWALVSKSEESTERKKPKKSSSGKAKEIFQASKKGKAKKGPSKKRKKYR